MHLTWAPGQDIDVTDTPTQGPCVAVLVIWPAFGTPARYYRHLTPVLAQHGMASVVVEYPGRDTDDGIGRHTEYGYDALATNVYEAVMTHVRQEHPDTPVYLLGHSLGGQVCVFAAALHAGTPLAPDGVVLVATANPYWRGYAGLAALRSYVGTATMAAVARGVGYWPGDRLAFWGRQSRVLVADWARFARTGRLNPRGATRDYDQAVAAYDGDVLALSLPDDDLAPVPALERLLVLMPRAAVTRWHAPTALGHIQWVRDNSTVVPVIVDWVRAHVATRVDGSQA